MSKLKHLNDTIKELGLSPQAVVNLWLENKQLDVEFLHRIMEIAGYPPQPLPTRNLKVGDYAFRGGLFSPHPETYPFCIGVIGWLNPDKNAPKGKRGLIVWPEQIVSPWMQTQTPCSTGVSNQSDGCANTKELVKMQQRIRTRILGVDYCLENTPNQPFDLYWPAVDELKKIVENCEIIRPALEKIEGEFIGFLFSSTEADAEHAYTVYSRNGRVEKEHKAFDNRISFVIAF